jgi:selenocysteine-specific elongation factor
MKHVILGTAGHIDHGKTTLVKALTGIDTDRLPEEKARGITIDLGFAHLVLADLCVGIVDVPGHEDLIRNMLAGATGFDAVLLVVAADEGIMPQTREHLAIARLLCVQRLVVALTKTDLVDADWLELVRADVTELIAALDSDAPVVAVSASTGAGLDELRAALAAQLSKASARLDNDVFRMPIDRVFSVRGTGTVVTGTVWSGRAAHHDLAWVLPHNVKARIRAVQTHGVSVEQGSAGERAAFALTGAERSEIVRGAVLVTAESWRATTVLTARVTLLPGYQLKQRQRVRVHLGTAEVMARVVLLDDAWIQLRLEAPMVARAGDRCVLRSYSPVGTIGGAQVAEVERARKRIEPGDEVWLAALLDGAAAERIRAAVALTGSSGCAFDVLPLHANVSPQEVAEFTGALPSDVARIGNALVSASVLEQTISELIRLTREQHRNQPLVPGIERALLLSRLPAALAETACRIAQERGLLTARGSIIALADFQPDFAPRQAQLRDQLVEKLRAGGLAPPSVSELKGTLKSDDVQAILRLLEAQGQVTSVSLDLYVDAAVLAGAIRDVRTRFADVGPVPAAEFKLVLPVSRKYLIPLLEYFDRAGITHRDGEMRWVSAAGAL